MLVLLVSLLLQQPATPAESRLRLRIQHQGEDQTGRLVAAELQGIFSRAPAYLLIGDDKQPSDVTVALTTLPVGPLDTESRSTAVAVVMYTTKTPIYLAREVDGIGKKAVSFDAPIYLGSELNVIGRNAVSLGAQRLSVSIEQSLKKLELVK